MDKVLSGLGVAPYPYADAANGLYERRLQNGNKEILSLFNCTEDEKTVTIKERAVDCQGGELSGGKVKIPALTAAYLTIEK